MKSVIYHLFSFFRKRFSKDLKIADTGTGVIYVIYVPD